LQLCPCHTAEERYNLCESELKKEIPALVLQFAVTSVLLSQIYLQIKMESQFRKNWRKDAMSESKFVHATFARLAALVLMPIGVLCLNGQAPAKTYKHASQYQVAILDQNLRVVTGSDVTRAKNTTDAKLGGGGQGIHLLHTDAGDYRVEAPINKGLTFMSAMGSNAYNPAQTIHNKWFLDSVQSGTKVLFASECASPNKKHPNDAVRCTFWFPDPDSTTHEYQTLGDFTPYTAGDGSNTQKTANTLCGTGKLNPQTEAQLCAPVTQPIPPPPPPKN
jgi:hypothetical protein